MSVQKQLVIYLVPSNYRFVGETALSEQYADQGARAHRSRGSLIVTILRRGVLQSWSLGTNSNDYPSTLVIIRGISSS